MKLFQNPRRIALRSGVFLVLAGCVWMIWHFWPNPHLARARELREQLTGEAGQSLSADQRRELWGQLRAEAKQLSPEQRRNLWSEQRRKGLSRYHSLSPQEKVAYLDAQIDRMAQWRRDQAQAGGGPGFGAGQNRVLSPDERDKRRRDRLDLTTPEDRALRSEFFKDLQTRRQQRGLGGFGFPGGRG